LVLLFWPEGKGFGRAVFWWNIIGAADLLLAVGTGGWLNLTRPGSIIELAGLPLTLVPLWLVPVLLSSHLYLLRQRLAGCRGAVTGNGEAHPAASN
jgi:fatty acid desaturase